MINFEEFLPLVSKKQFLRWGFPKMVVPPKHPKMVIFSRKTPWLLGKPTILGHLHINVGTRYHMYRFLLLFWDFGGGIGSSPRKQFLLGKMILLWFPFESWDVSLKWIWFGFYGGSFQWTSEEEELQKFKNCYLRPGLRGWILNTLIHWGVQAV